MKVLAIIEIDDKTHDLKAEKDIERDHRLAEAGYKTIRFDCRKAMPTQESLRAAIGAMN
jgi:very-short-patch-repair endonuclease